MSQMTIGRLASAAGVHVETIRYYQRLGLLERPARPPGGVRRYAPAALQKVRFIQRAKALGFSLAEVRRLMRLEAPRSCRAARALAEQKLEAVESRVTDLERLRTALRILIRRCNQGRGKAGCPIIETLAQEP